MITAVGCDSRVICVCMNMAESANNSEDDRLSCKILIIGAGMAGLSAATHLLKNNETDILIVEARGRIGGRIVAAQVGTINITCSLSDRSVQFASKFIYLVYYIFNNYT